MVAGMGNGRNEPNGGKNSIWLVKSGERILGPYSTEEVQQRLLTKEFVVIDEVVGPQSRWRYFRDEPAFAATVEEIRKGLMNSREDTEIQGATSTQTQTQTNTDSEIDPSLLTASTTTAATVSRVDIPVSEVRDAEFTEDSSSKRAASGEKVRTVRQYGYGQDQNVRKELSRHARLVWLATFLVILGVIFVLLRAKGPANPGGADQIIAFNRVVSEGRGAWDHGEFDEALTLFRKADGILPGHPEAIVRLAPLMMKLENQTVAAKRLLEDLRAKPIDIKTREEAQLGLGLAALMTDDLVSASNIFSEIVLASPGQTAAQFNLGMSAYMRKDYPEAVKAFLEAVRVSPELSAAHLMLVRSYIKLGDDSLKTAAEILDTFVQRHSDYRQEGEVIASWLEFEIGNKKKGAALARAALETDPFMTEDHFHDPFLFTEPLSWAQMLTMCKEIDTKLENSVGRALFSICQEKAGKKAEADKSVRDSLEPIPEDPNLLAASAYLLMKAGRDSDAKAVLRLATKNDGSRLAFILSGRNCATLHDDACAREAWNRLAREETPSLAAYVGLASLEADPSQWLVKAETLSPRYLPAIRMREGTRAE